ncbi:MAG: precorrin-6y C5,15-methyltransferase (decarboxylating) subunit CbiE [Bacteroidaceae bacterium]|nr:precorrin-6y C5,15-methyltransferase (decarboxylating) subunit CbiE [Bacteroidaceae bacterium]
MSKQLFHIIGISDNPGQELTKAAEAVIAAGKVFSGGKRHYELMRSRIPQGAQWIEITVPLADVFRQYKGYREIVVFASGDPLFYGFAATVQRELPEGEIKVYPAFNSLQMLAHRMLMPYQDMRAVSLTGRPWKEFEDALIRGEKLIGVLTDRTRTPRAIASMMQEYGYDNYSITIGECMGNPEHEKVTTMTVAQAIFYEADFPNCMILQITEQRGLLFGIPEERFELLDGRVNMITKMPIRLATLAALELGRRRSFWDIGFCTGSVSIEARLQFPHLEITAFEKRPEGKELLSTNSRRFGAPGINGVTGDFLEVDPNLHPAPDAVFIGGHGGKMKEMLENIAQVLLPGGVIVFNSVSDESAAMFREGVAAIGRSITGCTEIKVDDHNTIKILKAE